MAQPQKGVGTAQRRPIDPGGGVNAGPPMIELVSMLNKRAKLPETPLGLERRKIVQFDAWTDPRILEYLEEHKDSISDEARDLFCKRQPKIDAKVLRCAFDVHPYPARLCGEDRRRPGVARRRAWRDVRSCRGGPGWYQ
jgi:hypothetical protein